MAGVSGLAQLDHPRAHAAAIKHAATDGNPTTNERACLARSVCTAATTDHLHLPTDQRADGGASANGYSESHVGTYCYADDAGDAYPRANGNAYANHGTDTATDDHADRCANTKAEATSID